MPLFGNDLYYKDFDDMTEKEKEEISGTYGSSVFSSGAWSMASFEMAYREQVAREEEEQRLYDERYDTWDDPEPEKEYHNDSFEYPFNWDEEISYSYDPFEYVSSSNSSSSASSGSDYLKDQEYDFNRKRYFGDRITILQLIVYWMIVPRMPLLMTKFYEFFNMRRMMMSSEIFRNYKFVYYYSHFYSIIFMIFIILYVHSRTEQYLYRKNQSTSR